jgi:hypothetical protein
VVEEYEAKIKKLKDVIEYEKDFLDYFSGVIEDTETDKLIHLLLKYYESEYL